MKNTYKIGPVLVAVNDYLEIRPGTVDSAQIQTISYGGAVELYVSEDGNDLLVDLDTSAGTWTSLVYFTTHYHFYKVKNVAATPILISADGFII